MTQTAEIVKIAWIDELHRLISFEAIPEGEPYTAGEETFWARILELMRTGYRVQ